MDGNKRTAVYAAAYLLEKLGHVLEAEQQELEDFAVRIAQRGFEPEDMAFWFEEHTRRS